MGAKGWLVRVERVVVDEGEGEEAAVLTCEATIATNNMAKINTPITAKNRLSEDKIVSRINHL